ncbi:phage/plasmid replication protein, II/X family [Chloroflexota bacterium]
MLDWFTGKVGFDGNALRLNRLCEMTPEGDLVWQLERKSQISGSYDSSIQIGRDAPTEEMIQASGLYNLLCNPVVMVISGNPTKFLQGHNVFGPTVSALAPLLKATVREFPEGIRPPDADSNQWPALMRTRVDITTSVNLAQHRLVHEWLRTAGNSTRSKHGRPMVSGDTVYWGKPSTRWTMKAYCKFCELEAHPPKDKILKDTLKEYCEGQLRLELCLRRPELKNRGTLDENLVWEFMNKIQVGVAKIEVDEDMNNLNGIVGFTLAKWLNGKDVRFELNKRTFYRHRKIILEKTGVDISLEPQKKQFKRINYDIDYLKNHEVNEIPSVLQGYMFKPGTYPKWEAH